MNIFEILAKVATLTDPDKVMFQNLNQGDRNIDILKREAKITFYTEIGKGSDMINGAVRGHQFVPILLWLPKEALDKAIATEGKEDKAV